MGQGGGHRQIAAPAEEQENERKGGRVRMEQSTGSFALRVENGGMEDLEARKLYPVLRDREAAREGYITVIDESGEGP